MKRVFPKLPMPPDLDREAKKKWRELTQACGPRRGCGTLGEFLPEKTVHFFVHSRGEGAARGCGRIQDECCQAEMAHSS